MLLTINNSDNVKTLIKEMKNKDWVIFYYATWCGACQMMKPEWNKFEEDEDIAKNNKYNIAIVESNQLPLISNIDTNVMGFPTIKKYKHNGTIIELSHENMNKKGLIKFSKIKKSSSKKKPSTKGKKKKPLSKRKPSTKGKKKKPLSKRKPSTKGKKKKPLSKRKPSTKGKKKKPLSKRKPSTKGKKKTSKTKK